MSTAIFPGSFAPFTKGHLDLIRKAGEIFDKVIVVVADNGDKLNYRKTPIGAIKKDILADAIYNEEAFDVVELPAGVLLTEYAEFCQGNVTYLRGVRDSADFAYEMNYKANLQSLQNEEYNNTISLILVPAEPELAHISSSAVRQLLKCKGWVNQIHKYVPLNSLREIIGGNSAFIEDCWYYACSRAYGELYFSRPELRDKCGDMFRNLVYNYGYRARRYHTINHIFSALTELYIRSIELRGCLPCAEDVMALFFHDAVYDPHQKDNEKQSADLYTEFAKSLNVPHNQGFDSDVVDGIMSTVDECHLGPSYVRDADRSILSKTPPLYDAYCSDLKEEYCRGFGRCNDTQFKVARVAWISNTLADPNIYGTWLFKDGEAAARANLHRERQQLEEELNGHK